MLVDALEKAHAAGWLAISMSGALIHESGHATQRLAGRIHQQPADEGAVPKVFVFSKVEHSRYVTVERTHVAGITRVEPHRKLDKFAGLGRSQHFQQSHIKTGKSKRTQSGAAS